MSMLSSKFAIEIFFDDEFDSYVRNLWDICAEKSTSTFLTEIKGVEPHIALAVYENVEKQKILKLFKDFKLVDEFSSSVYFPSVSIFKTTKVTFLNPVVNDDMRNYIKNTHSFFEQISNKCLDYYKQYVNMPHVTIGMNTSIDSAIKTHNLVLKSFEPKIAKASKLALVEIIYENNICIECKTLDCKTLKHN